MPFKKLFLFSATLALGAFSTDALAFQNPTPTAASQAKSQTSVNLLKTDNSENVQRVIDTAEQQYRLGASFLDIKQYSQAREAFDRSVDTMLTASIEARKDPRFRAYYLELVERIYKHQVSSTQDGVAGFKQQGYETSPLDELAKIDLDAEGVSRTGTVDVKGFDFEFTAHPAVVQFINFFTQGKGRNTMETGLRRSGRYRAMTERIFKEEGVPLDIIWLAQVESVWTPQALSQAAAKGIWQFIPSTGERFGLRQDGLVDERISPEKATRAAARYLKFLNEFFQGDWLLAMAAYNCGENGIDRSIARCGYADFWELYDRGLMPMETRNYVPAILAVTIIAKNPEKYGFNVSPDQPWSYDSYELQTAFDLRVAADLLDVPFETLRELNPELKRGVTPASGYTLRLPKNSRDQFELAFNQLTPDQYLRVNSDLYADGRSSRYKSRYVRKNGRNNYRVKNAAVKKSYGKTNKSGKAGKAKHRRR